MGETDGDTEPQADTRSSTGPDERPSPGPGQDSLQVPTVKKRRKSPTPGSVRGRSMTPIRGRSQTPFTLYLTRRSATPSTWRSITPFLRREEREKTPFELGSNIKQQLFCNKAVFDKALVMDITEPEVEPVRYITTDLSVIDRAAVMDVSNVEVIYVVEEYEEYESYTEEDEKEAPDEEKKKKKKPSKKKEAAAKKREEAAKKKEEAKARKEAKRKEKEDSPKMQLKLEMGGGPKASKKMFEQSSSSSSTEKGKAKPPPKKTKSKVALEMEKKAKAAAKAAEEAKKKEAQKPKRETYEERQARLKAEREAEQKARASEESSKGEDEGRESLQKEESERESEQREETEERENETAEERQERKEQEALEREEKRAERDREETEEPTEITEASESGEEEADGEESEVQTDAGEAEEMEEEGGAAEEEEHEEVEENDEFEKETDKEDTRRGSGSSEESFIRPDPEEEEKWKKIAEEEGEEFMKQMRKASKQVRSEKERDADWKKQREASRLPAFVVYLTDRAAEEGHNVKLTCAVNGPDISIKWLKDGKQISSGPRQRIVNNNNICSLELVNPVSSDSGEYACSISNANDEVISSCIVTIYPVYKDEPTPPTFSSIRDFYHLHDDELTIECHIHGTPRPRVTWIKDAVPIKPSFKFTILEEAHGVYKLMIYRPSAKDSGKYICRAVNDSGEMEISHNVEFVKPKNFHIHGIFHAHSEFQKEKEETAKRAMEEALKSKEEYEQRRAGKSGGGRIRQDDGPPVPPKNKLMFASHLRDRIAIQGTTVKLMCSILGPDPAVRWFKDDNPVAVGPKVKNLSTENTAAIQLVDVQTESSGVYKCVAKNQYSEIDTSCYLKVYSAQGEGDEQEPMFALPMRDVYHSLENDLIIDTKIRGNPRPTISWLKDELSVTTDARVQQIEHLDGICELIINKPTARDSGKYTCVAENKLGTQKLTHSVVVQDLPVSKRSSGGMGAPEDKQSTQAKPQKSDQDDQKGKAPGKGKKKDADVAEGGRRRVAEPEPSVKAKLYFIGNMSNRYVPEGSKVKLSAVIGGPDPQVKWLKNENNVAYGPRIKNMSREGLAVLEISNASVEDSGQYTCIARNSANEIITTALLHVYQPNATADLEPMFTRALKDTYHLNTNELILESHVRGQPMPTVTWVKDGIEIKNDDKYQIIIHPDGACELIIDKPGNNDSGKYVCQAENSLGKCEIFHHVLFEGKDSHIAENIHGVFHADPQYKKQREKEIVDVSETKDEEGKGKGKGKGKPGKGGKTEGSAAIDQSSKSVKEEKREKKIGVYFATKLTDRVVAEGSKVKLTCYVEGTDPQVKWLKDDQPVVYGPKLRQNYREGLCTLELLSASQSDSGNYKCYAKNNAGESETMAKLTVYANPGSADVPPTFTRAIKDTYHAKINELILDCHVRGLPTPAISWTKDGVKIEPSEKYQQIDHDDGTCELIVSDPITYDSGKYVCIAENRLDKAEIVHLVQLSVKEIRHGTVQGSPPREMVTKESKEAKPDAPKKEEKKKEKKKGEGDISSGGRRGAAPPPDPKKKIHFATFLSNRTVSESSNVRMTAYIEGPDPQCRWFKGETPIVYGPKSKSSCQDGLAVLVLSNLTPEDSGEYILVAKNSENEITTSCTLTVYPKVKDEAVAPVFTVGIKDTYYLNEDELVLDCRVRGYPHPEIEWMKGSEQILNNDKYQQLDQADGYCKLIIRNPSEQDSGLYSCEARNAVSSEKISHSVQFEGQDRFILEKAHGFFHRDPNKPHLSKSLGDHTVPAGGTMALQAEFAPTSTPIEVQWLKNKMPLTNIPNMKTFADKGVYTLAIEKVTAEVAGTYTCRASNAFGRIESNANVDIVGATMKGGKPALFLSRPDGEMKIAVNDPFSISFRVQGDPKPKLILMKGTKDITKSDRVSKEASDDYIRFTIQKAQVLDSGTYFVVARNQHGSDRLFVTVTIKNPKKKI